MPKIKLTDSEGWRPPPVDGEIWQVREGGKGRRRTIRKCVVRGGLWKVGPWEEPPGLMQSDQKPGLYSTGRIPVRESTLSCPDEWKALIGRLGQSLLAIRMMSWVRSEGDSS